MSRLQELVCLFTKSEEYLTLQRLVRVVEPEPPAVKQENPELSRLIVRYPYLYQPALSGKLLRTPANHPAPANSKTVGI
ncbi:hypothetical protein [Kamptonema formosum]|uniref:hypothetical protein n=1 Tax=Kamptonema formosum TaxID=331992 RepID=UPI000344C5BC|nr:hypothetical protein [Oscillatoria sp. PCC 10802]